MVGLFVLLTDFFEFIELGLNGLVFDFLKEQGWLRQARAGLQQIGATETFPIGRGKSDHLAQTCRREGEEGLESDGEVGHKLEREVENGLHALGISLDHLPWFGVSEILVADAGEVHGLLLRIAEAELLEQALHFGLHTAEFFDRGAVGFGEFAAFGHAAFVVFLRELEGAVHEVAVDGHQFVVVARLEVGPREVVVLRFGRVGREHVTQHVLFAREVHEIFVEPHGPVARSGDLVVFEIEKFVRRHVVGENV